MKTFLIYLILVIAVILATDFLANIILESNYRQLDYEIATTSPEITISTAEGTNSNGRIRGTIRNKTDSLMQDVYIKTELISDIGNVLGTEYLKAGNLQPDQKKDFELNYHRYYGVKKLVISTTNEVVKNEVNLEDIIKVPIGNARTYYWIAKLIVFASMPQFFLFTFLK